MPNNIWEYSISTVQYLESAILAEKKLWTWGVGRVITVCYSNTVYYNILQYKERTLGALVIRLGAVHK
jgi:hypothetical protein